MAKDYREIMESAAQYIVQAKPRLDGPAKVADFFRPLLQGKEQEEMWVINMDTKFHPISFYCVSVGLLDRSQIHAREIFRRAIVENACRIVMVHNHPSGDPLPSAQDIECTRSISAAGKIIGIDLSDHIVIGFKTTERPQDHMSLREANLI